MSVGGAQCVLLSGVLAPGGLGGARRAHPLPLLDSSSRHRQALFHPFFKSNTLSPSHPVFGAKTWDPLGRPPIMMETWWLGVDQPCRRLPFCRSAGQSLPRLMRLFHAFCFSPNRALHCQ